MSEAGEKLHAGRFITFEGGEGVGKSTQISLLARRLEGLGHSVAVTREPGGSPGAEAVRHLLMSGVGKSFGHSAEAILFAAARDDHVRHVIRPALDDGRWVLCDRFSDSTRVYQGALGHVSIAVLDALERAAVGATRPDLTFVLDLAPEIGLARAASRRGLGNADRFESEALGFHQELREAYRALVHTYPRRCVLIDAAGDPAKVSEAIWDALVERLPQLTEQPNRARAFA